ncbi:hypothetical protein EYV94_13580 [Puteibacter caeruleilacunae]|nr:hypothetical protein EYV94_13580 [Puteibacter caeruleilacunae]
MLKTIKIIFIQLHKITGSILSILFLVWFVSGIVLIFEGFPHADKEQNFHNLTPFTAQQFTTIKPPLQSWKGRVNLEMCDGKPIYRNYTKDGKQCIFDAKTLTTIDTFSEDYARRLVSATIKAPIEKIEIINDFDSWIPWSHFEAYFPILKCYMNDSKHTILYVSQKTGEIVQETNRAKRWAARCGAIPHWIYFKQIRLQRGLWIDLVIWLSFIGIIASITGIVVGFIRQKRGKGITPYKKPMYKWHHITGYIFGVFVFTFILSGFFSLARIPNWMVFVSEDQQPSISWNQPTDMSMHSTVAPAKIWDALKTKNNIRKITWKSIHNQPCFFVYGNDYKVPEVYVMKDDSIYQKPLLTKTTVENLANRYLNGQPYELCVQNKYDNYYNSTSKRFLPLPVYKLKIDNEAQTWLYIDPKTGEEIRRYSKNNRLQRWLYQGLHKFNLKWFDSSTDWLRKLLLILLSLGGIVVSVTGVWLSVIWIKRVGKKN